MYDSRMGILVSEMFEFDSKGRRSYGGLMNWLFCDNPVCCIGKLSPHYILPLFLHRYILDRGVGIRGWYFSYIIAWYEWDGRGVWNTQRWDEKCV